MYTYICTCVPLFKITGSLVYYQCETHNGSSGSPVMKVVNGTLQVVALHRGCEKKYLNYGSLFAAVLKHANGEGGN